MTPTAVAIIAVICSAFIGVVGFVIGNYRARAAFQKDQQEFKDGLEKEYQAFEDKLKDEYQSKDDCKKCALHRDMEAVKSKQKRQGKRLDNQAKELEKGNKTFKEIQVDLLVIKVQLGVKSNAEVLKAALAELEPGRAEA